MVVQRLSLLSLYYIEQGTLKDGRKVNEIMVTGRVVKIMSDSFVLDDGTARIEVKGKGEGVVRVIGRVRIYGKPYIVARIIKRCEETWIPHINKKMLALIRTLQDEGVDKEDIIARLGNTKDLVELQQLGLVYETKKGLHVLENKDMTKTA